MECVGERIKKPINRKNTDRSNIMGIFSRFNDIVSSNINAMLEKAENPEKIIRLVIQEMEDTLVEVRTTAARTIADKKTLHRRLDRLRFEAQGWSEKAELAVRRDREDLARAALAEKAALQKLIDQMEAEALDINGRLEQLNEDIGRLQAKLTEARERKKALQIRRDTATSSLKTRESLSDDRIHEAMSRFEHIERKMDQLEGQVESYDLGRERPLKDEFADLAAEDTVEQELAELKRRVQASDEEEK
jgi:phage shock protein A